MHKNGKFSVGLPRFTAVIKLKSSELVQNFKIQRSGVIRDRVIGDKKAVLQKVLPWVIGDTSDFGKRFANQNRSFYNYSYKKVAPGTRGAH